MCFKMHFLHNMQPIQSAFLLFTVCTIFLSSLTLCNTPSFLTRSVQLIFSTFLQHHNWKLSRCFWSTLRSVHVLTLHTRCSTSPVSSLNLSPICCGKDTILVENSSWQSWISFRVYILHHLSPCYQNSWNVPHVLGMVLLRSHYYTNFYSTATSNFNYSTNHAL
jgi:hypothetical protein